MFPLAHAILAVLPLAPAVGAPRQEPPGLERQILWQRSLEDALAISAAEGRPILVAVNMDGESASERIVRERYRDPAFVSLTRPFTCVVASAFRHAPRDHDEQGRRIACPRLGEITCGEHIALEPVLFERFLGGERIAPRHTLSLPDGTKPFDLYLLFDMRKLDEELAKAAQLAPPPAPAASAPGGSWSDLVRRKDQRGRLELEMRLASSVDSDAVAEDVIDTVASSGDAGSVEALRILLQRARTLSRLQLARIGEAALALGIASPLAAVLRERIAGLGRFPGAPGLGEEERLLPLLGRLDGSTPATRTLLLSYLALGNDSESAACAEVLGTTQARASVERLDIGAWWLRMRGGPSSAPAPPAIVEELPSAEVLEGELADLDRELEKRPDDAELVGRYGKATLALARRRIESGGTGVQLLLEDADRFLSRAWQAGRRDTPLQLARARTAYLLQKFAEQEQIAEEAAAAARGDERIEALRWLGDASARLLSSRSGGDADVEVAGILRAAWSLTEVVASSEANAADWVGLGSFLGALGMRREELAVLQAGAEKFPSSPALRNAMNGRLQAAGRTDLVTSKAEWIAGRYPGSADCAWWAGFARLLYAESARRGEEADRAIEQYRRASRWFEACATANPEYAENVRHYLALCALGRGFAHLLEERQVEAAKCLAEAITFRPDVAAARDGLDREAIDLLDGALEWRESSPSPVEVRPFLDTLVNADPDNPFWARSISDSELREALRADGRGDARAGDAYLRLSIDAGRRAVAISGDEENRHALAQALTVTAERLLERRRDPEARKHLVEAAPLLGLPAPADQAAGVVLEELAGKLRTALGPARPRVRAGR